MSLSTVGTEPVHPAPQGSPNEDPDAEPYYDSGSAAGITPHKPHYVEDDLALIFVAFLGLALAGVIGAQVIMHFFK